MLGDTEAMTRTTDIAHFYKVTTQPDPEWGSGLSAPELGKLLEGAYITSTDKTISFVVGGVGKTKCKTARERSRREQSSDLPTILTNKTDKVGCVAHRVVRLP